MTWPARPWLCLDCRMTLTGRACPGGHRRVVALRDPGGREALVQEIWGPPRRSRELVATERSGARDDRSLDGATCLGTALEAVSGLDAVLLVVIGIGILWLLGAWIARAVRAQRGRRLASGARRRLPAIAHTGQVGTILPRKTEAVPGLGEGVAFAAEYDLHGRRMLHDAACLGFDVLLDTGERVVLLAGPCLIALDEAPEVRADTAAHLASLDPVRLPAFDPFVHARVRAVVLRPGDRVEVCNLLDALPDPAAGYRDPGQLRAPRGVIRLRPR